MTRAATAAALVFALLLAACGGSSGPSKTDYIVRADKVCRAARAEALPLVKELTAGGLSLSRGQAEALAATARRLHATEASYLAQLRALDVPSGDKDDVDKFLTPTGQVVTAIDVAAAALARGDVATTASLLGQAQAAGLEARNAADAYGFKNCGGALALAT
jgi:hypothetical protein